MFDLNHNSNFKQFAKCTPIIPMSNALNWVWRPPEGDNGSSDVNPMALSKALLWTIRQKFGWCGSFYTQQQHVQCAMNLLTKYTSDSVCGQKLMWCSNHFGHWHWTILVHVHSQTPINSIGCRPSKKSSGKYKQRANEQNNSQANQVTNKPTNIVAN